MFETKKCAEALAEHPHIDFIYNRLVILLEEDLLAVLDIYLSLLRVGNLAALEVEVLAIDHLAIDGRSNCGYIVVVKNKSKAFGILPCRRS